LIARLTALPCDKPQYPGAECATLATDLAMKSGGQPVSSMG
jgi:hypothetical protein